MKIKIFIPTLLISVLFISCNRLSNKKEFAANDFELSKALETEPNNTAENKQQIPVGKFSPLSGDSAYSPLQTASIRNPDWDKKIIKTATMRLEIKDFKKYNDYVHGTVKNFGAYIAQEEQNLSNERSETVISIKVPVMQFEAMMNQLPGDSAKVLERKISSEDVTGEVVDTKSRLEAKKQMRLKYLEFLKQSKNMEEVLQVQGEINNIQEQIESAASRIGFLSHQSLYSTINLSFYQPTGNYEPDETAPSFFTRISNAFKAGASWVGDLLIGLISL